MNRPQKPSVRLRRSLYWGAVALMLAGCTGSIDSENGGNGGSGANGAAPNPFGTTDPGTLEDGVPFSTRIGRLTHQQYDNTVSELLHISVSASSEFEADPVFNGYNNSIQDLTVAGRLGRDYRRAAEDLATRVVGDATAYAAIVPCEPSAAGCAAKFVAEFGKRAHRRPLTGAERGLYEGLFAKGADLVASGDAFKDGVQVVVEAMLQSPKFLYRAELTKDAQADHFLKLDGYEVAQRLSYMILNTMPDEALFAAADAGKLDEAPGIAEQALRLLELDAARRPVSDFHSQWLHMRHYNDLSRSEDLFPNFSSDLGPVMQQEALSFVNHVVFDLGKGYKTLLSAPFSFVNSRLAPLYGLNGTFGDELQKVELDPTVRKGLLTQIGFLASNAYPGETSPIHRGVFLYRRILCKKVPDPVGIDTSQGKVDNPRTTREAIETQTGQTGCISCHTLFNPLGFAFEHFNAVGEQRAMDRGNPVDTTGQTAAIDGKNVAFQSATELIDAIAESTDARACYANNWLRYAYGRDDAPSDAKTIEQIATAMQSDDYSVKDMLKDLTQSKAFRFRAPNRD